MNVCPSAVALPPEKIDNSSVEERMQDTEGSATVGPHKQLQFEVSIQHADILGRAYTAFTLNFLILIFFLKKKLVFFFFSNDALY